ncbi:18764_t:CDS:2 [Gigaspora margarita]|uniref:18764_t:CDS:1 n=1 Tax=Gigaspora margarita TaxID=4874 RepID=A0ABN7W1X2_GIGMA|nr:18764_t:CDS:2 [Gigaspora margarita]
MNEMDSLEVEKDMEGRIIVRNKPGKSQNKLNRLVKIKLKDVMGLGEDNGPTCYQKEASIDVFCKIEKGKIGAEVLRTFEEFEVEKLVKMDDKMKDRKDQKIWVGILEEVLHCKKWIQKIEEFWTTVCKVKYTEEGLVEGII